MVTISDIKIGKDAPGGPEIDYYEADVVTAGDYYPGGMQMPGRKYNGNGADYRYSINGQEKTPEIAPNTTTAEFWQYDAKILRRWNVDPVVKDDESPYFAFGGNPIAMIDPNGLDWYHNRKTHETQWFDSKKEARKAGFRLNVNNQWLPGDKPDSWIWHGNTKEDIMVASAALEPVVVTAKIKKPSLFAQSWLGQAFDKGAREYPQWNAGYTEYFVRRRGGLPISQAGDDDYYTSHVENYERHWRAYQDWRSMNYAVLDVTLLFVPVPKVGMLRWIRPFGGTSGRVFWSGGGVTGRAFAEATEHAFLYGGTTLERTLTGRSITMLQTITGRNAMTGKLWTWASKRFAKGSVGEVNVFLNPTLMRPNAAWYTEKSILEGKNQIIYHFIK